MSSVSPHPVICNICKATDHKANACSFSWASAVPTTPRHNENSGPTILPNDDNADNPTDDNKTDVSNDDADEEEDDILHESPIDDEDIFPTDVVSVANPGILSTCTTDDGGPTARGSFAGVIFG